MKEGKVSLRKIISIIFLFVILIFAYQFYQKNNFNNFVKAEYKIGNSKFERDAKQKYAEKSSYKIENRDYNDAMFYETIPVTPNTPYKVTCQIKTENVKSKNANTDSGAHRYCR